MARRLPAGLSARQHFWAGTRRRIRRSMAPSDGVLRSWLSRASIQNRFLERGLIEQPDLIILADETLLDAPDAGVLANQQTASAIFINTQQADSLVERYSIRTSGRCR